MSRRTLGIRRGNSVQERIQNPVQTLAALRLLPTTDVVDKAIIIVEDEGALFRYDYTGVGADDGVNIITPGVGPGRWFFVAGGSGGGGATGVDLDVFVLQFPAIHSKTVREVIQAHGDLSILAVVLWHSSSPTTTGNYTLSVRAKGPDLLDPTPVDITSLGVGSHTIPLTSTPGAKDLSDGDLIEIETSGDSADLVGEGFTLQVIYESQGGGLWALPPLTGVQYAVLMEDPASNPIFQPLRESWISPDFEILSFVRVGGFVELGDTLVNPSFTASYSLPSTTVVIQDDQGGPPVDVSGTSTAFSYPGIYVETVYGNQVAWNMTADDGVQADAQGEVTTWVQRLYYGVATDPGPITEVFVEGLSDNPLANTKSRTFTDTAGALDYFWYAYRSAYGDATFTIGGYDGGFAKVATILITNAFAIAETYHVYRSDNLALGTTTVEVS